MKKIILSCSLFSCTLLGGPCQPGDIVTISGWATNAGGRQLPVGTIVMYNATTNMGYVDVVAFEAVPGRDSCELATNAYLLVRTSRSAQIFAECSL